MLRDQAWYGASLEFTFDLKRCSAMQKRAVNTVPYRCKNNKDTLMAGRFSQIPLCGLAIGRLGGQLMANFSGDLEKNVPES